MKIYMSFMTKKHWESVRDEFNLRRHDTNIAQLVNDMPEEWRKEVLRQLDRNGVPVDEAWELLQRDSLLNDPNHVFPLVATPWLLGRLPESMTTCNLIDNEDPIWGPCGCNSGGYGSGVWRLILDHEIPPERSQTAKPMRLRPRPPTPLPPMHPLEDGLQDTSPSDSDFDISSEEYLSEYDSSSSSSSGPEAVPTTDWYDWSPGTSPPTSPALTAATNLSSP
ncbi:hypothetical protein Purlil1_13608 [Purpureocillium lilacinum]|uniref:Clr5 domain-containing protein n=1 Tax=Purpureocillium lilacinum TaxID=33203 RepID=A0ABR0BDM1_PURLI|nr:hypothetical protein Purlil1_13608 [Purpureocillium lilacinum]